MDSPRLPLNLDELRRLKWLLGGVLALVSLWTVYFLDVEALALVGVAVVAIIAVLVWPALPARVPPLVWRLAVPVIIAAIATDWYFAQETLPVLIRLGVLLVLYRAVSYRRQREDLQLVVLGLFLIVMAGVLTVSVGFAVLLLAFTACALCYLFVVTLIALADGTQQALTYEEMSQCPVWARGGWGRLGRRLGQAMDWRLLGFAVALFGAVVVLSGALFLVMPRFEIASGFFLDRYITRKSRTGFTETVRFGDVGELVQDNSVAMRVDVTDGAALPAAPYWRLVVLDEYTPQGFRISTGLKNELIRAQRVTQTVRGRYGAAGAGSGVGGVWTFYVEPGVSRFLPLPGGFAQLRLREVLPVQTSYPANRGAMMGMIEGVRVVGLRTEPMTMTAFQLEGVELASRVPDRAFARALGRRGPEGASAATDGRSYDAGLTLRGPEGGANRAVLAAVLAEITGGAKLGATDFSTRATAWLRARHGYALAARIPRGEGDEIVRWLASREAGFCEHFASALTVLCRAEGFPARVVAGFHGGVLNAYEHYYMVRNADAHAWVEVFGEEGAWLRCDPTNDVASGAAQPGENAVRAEDRSWSARFDVVRVLWYRRIVNFDARQQEQLVDDVRSFTTGSGNALRTRLEGLSRWLKIRLAGPWDWRRAGRVAVELLALWAAGWGVVCGGRVVWWRWRAWRRPGEFDPVRRAAGRALRRIAERGALNDEGRMPEDGDCAAVVADLQRLRYGRRETWPEPSAVLRRARRVRLRGRD